MPRSLVFATALISAALAFPATAQNQSTTPNAGRNLAAACAGCHGTNGQSQPGMPPLAGMPREYVSQQLKEFRDGKRPSTVMQKIARGYTDEQINLIAAYFAAQKAK
jgi:sulfide dehydrogenase cytochrome subunit